MTDYDTIEIGSAGKQDETCPYTGWPLTRLAEFSNFPMGPGHFASLSKIGDSIVCIECRGYQGYYDAVAMDKLMAKITEFCDKTAVLKPYVQVYDKTKETGQQSISILRREAKYFESQQSTIIGLVFIQEASWLASFTRLAVSLYRPSTKVVVTKQYAEAVVAARKILEDKHRTRAIVYADIRIVPDWCYSNPAAGAEYQAGIVPGVCLYQSFRGSLSSDAVLHGVLAAQERMLAAVRQDRLPDFNHFVIDLSGCSDRISFLNRQYYLKETSRQNAKYQFESKVRVVVTTSPLLRAASKLFFGFLGQNLQLVASLEAALSLVSRAVYSAPDDTKPAKPAARNTGNFMVAQSDLEELNALLSRLLLAVDDNDLHLSVGNPLVPVAETLQLIRQDIVELREKDRENAERRLTEERTNQARLLDMMQSLERANEAVKASEVRYHTLFDQSRDAMMTIAPPTWHFTEGNAAALRLFGFDSLAEFQQHGPWDVSPEYQNDGQASREAVKSLVETAQRDGSCFFEWTHQNRSGGHIPCSVLLNRMEIDGQLIVHATVRDISDQKRILEELQKTADVLELRNAELDVAVSRAEAANRAKSEFLANMSHELRTPLNGMLGFIELLKTTSLSDLQRQYLDHTGLSGQSLLNIISDILDFSKIEAGMLDLDIIPTDLHQLIGQSIDLVKYGAEKKQLELIMDVDSGLPGQVWVDPTRLKQILANLLSNAVKFTAQGEIQLKVRSFPAGQDRHKIIFSVHDTGIGISPDQQSRLFKAFSQADASTTRKFGGTGLGLVIADLIAQKMASKIQVQSIEGEGSIFWFELLCRGEPAAGSSGLVKLPAARCLLIDDNKSVRLVFECWLTEWGLACVCCDNGRQATALLEESSPFDLIICDLQMPGLDGFETVQFFRKRSGLEAALPPVILLHPSTAEESILVACARLDIRMHLAKPVKPRVLHERLRTALHAPAESVPDCASSAVISKDQPGGIAMPMNQGENYAKTILVADDAPLNMDMFRSLLKFLAPDASLYEAVNGLEALEVYKRYQPDLVFMDVQMPEMDGLAATQEIRNLERATGGHTVIAALTAGASAEEEARCLSAGMDTFLTKPVEIDKIRAVLRGEVPARGRLNVGAAGFVADELRGRCSDNDELYREILSHALETFPGYLRGLASLVESADMDGLRRLAHQTRGAALNYACRSIATIAEKLETEAAASGDSASLSVLMAALAAEWARVCDAIQDDLGRLATAWTHDN